MVTKAARERGWCFFVEQRKVWVLEAAEEVGGVPVVLDFENLGQLSPEPSHAEHDPRNARAPLQGPPRKWVPDVSESQTLETASVGGVRVRARSPVPLDARTARAGEGLALADPGASA